jgi:hypothetical protein
MARPKPTKQDLKDRDTRAQDIKAFMRKFLFTEVRLAEVLGVSRRTIQMIKAGSVTPHPKTLRLWIQIRDKYEREAKFAAEQNGSKKRRGRKAA